MNVYLHNRDSNDQIFKLTRWPGVTHVRRDMCQVNCHPALHKSILWQSISTTEIQMIRSSYRLGGQRSPTSEETCAKSTAILHHIRHLWQSISRTEIQMIRSSYWLGGQGSATSEETCAKSTAILHHIIQSYDCLSPQQRFKWSDLHID